MTRGASTIAARCRRIAGWALVAPSAMVATARLGRFERVAPVLVAEALTPLLTIPAATATALGIVTGRRSLTAAGGALVALHLAWAAPELRPRRPLPVEAGDGPRLRLFSANLLYTNGDMGGIADELRITRPDVVALQELSPLNLAALKATGAMDRFPHRIVMPQEDGFGAAVLSHHPLADTEQLTDAGLRVPRTTVVLGQHWFRVYDVHVRAPMLHGGAYQSWVSQMSALRKAVATETGPVVLAGDFNATSGHRPFRELLHAGFRDAAVERGRWWSATWPKKRRWPICFVRVDHVLVSGAVAVLDVREGEGRGSDHRPVIADLALVD